MKTSKRALWRRSRPGLSLGVGCLCLCASLFGGQAADLPVVNEVRVKAEYVFRFAQYVEWPASAFEAEDSPIRIGVFDGDQITKELKKTFRDKKAGERPFEVVAIKSPDEMKGCQIVFLGRLGLWRLGDLIEKAGSRPILTIGDVDDFARNGVMINFRLIDRQVKFEINLASARAAGLKVSSKLLSLAEKVHGQ